jgi:hypothetical protein
MFTPPKKTTNKMGGGGGGGLPPNAVVPRGVLGVELARTANRVQGGCRVPRPPVCVGTASVLMKTRVEAPSLLSVNAGVETVFLSRLRLL